MISSPAMRRTAVVIAATLATAGCSHPSVGVVTPPLYTGPAPYFVHVADGLTAPSMGEPMRVAPRMFSAYQLSDACKEPARIDRLETPSRQLELRVGERVTLSALNVVAINDANVAVPEVPVAIEVEERNPAVVQLLSDDPDLNTGRLHVVGPGTLRLRVRTICGAANAGVTISGDVQP